MIGRVFLLVVPVAEVVVPIRPIVRAVVSEEEIAEDAAEVVAFTAGPAFPDVISDRQFFHALANQGTITQDEFNALKSKALAS